jgi:hypothetical protein
MAIPSITQAELKSIVNGMVHQKFDQCASPTVIMNRAVRFVLADMDLRSAKRSASLSPNMFENIYDYGAPSDLKGEKVIDLRKQVGRPSYEKWSLVDEKDFDRRKELTYYKVAVRDESFSKLLRIDGLPNTKKSTIHNCDSLTANGTWAAVGGTDASNLTIDTNNYITGNGSINFDMAKGAATGAIELTGATQVDLTDHDEKGSLFAWVFIPDYSDAEGDTVTNFILRWGNDSSNYWSRTITTANDGTTFKDGWNLLRFDWNGATETGTVAPATIDYLRLTVTKSTSLEADTDWRIDDVICVSGELYDVVYYTKYGWQTSAGAYIEESTATTDLLVADTDEIEMIANKTAEYASQELKEYEEVPYFKGEYNGLKAGYEKNNPSEALKKSRRYGSLPRLRR